jgi:hypothetical protein
MEEESEENNLNELFVQETLDPRIESVMPILNKLQKKVAEMKEVGELSEWADSLTEAPGAETLGHNVRTDAKNLKAFDLEESEDDIDDPVVSSITRRIIRQHPELLKHGPDKVLAAIADVADFVGDVEEIGSSDVSGWVKQVARQLNGVDEGMFDKVKDAVKTVGGKVLNKLGHDDDTELLKKIQKDAGIPASAQHGKPNMGHSKDEEMLDEIDMDTLNQVASHAVNTLGKPGAMAASAAGGAAIGATVGKGITKVVDYLKKKKEQKAFDKNNQQVAEDDIEESALQAYLGDKKYGKDGMDALRKAGQEHASEKTMQNIRAKYSKKEEPVAEEVDTGQYDAVKSSPKGDNDQNWDKPFREKIKQYAKELEKRQKEKEQGVAESEFAGDYATGEAGQWRNKGPKANKPATIGDLVGEGQDDLDTIRRLLKK